MHVPQYCMHNRTSIAWCSLRITFITRTTGFTSMSPTYSTWCLPACEHTPLHQHWLQISGRCCFPAKSIPRHLSWRVLSLASIDLVLITTTYLLLYTQFPCTKITYLSVYYCCHAAITRSYRSCLLLQTDKASCITTARHVPSPLHHNQHRSHVQLLLRRFLSD
jgi:hypothetical protein